MNMQQLVDSFKRAIPWLLFFLSLGLFLVGYFQEQQHNKEIFYLLGQTLLVGVLFNVVLKSFVFMGVFRDELREVIYEDRGLRRIADLKDLWCRVSRVLYKEKFPNISDHINNAIHEKYFPLAKQYYYHDYRRTCEVDWQNKSKQIVKFTETLEFNLIPTNPDDNIDYSFSISAPANDLEDFKLLELTIDEQDHKQSFQPVDFTDNDGVKRLKYDYKISLQGKTEYKVYRRSEILVLLNIEPYMSYVSQNFIHMANLTVECKTKDLRVFFSELGTAYKFENMGPKRATSTHDYISKKLEHIIFPNQGYILFVVAT